MAGTDGPTVQERDFLDSVLSGRPGQGGAAPDTSGQMAAMRNQIAQTMMARPGGGVSGGGDPYAAMRASMASRQPAGGGDPYAAMRASMASRAQPAAGGGGGFGTNPDTGKPYANGWEELARAQAQLDADPNAQYFGSKGPMSGSVTDIGWMNALQPWQGGVTSGGQPGSGVNTSGFIGGGGATRADPAYWGAGGAGAQKSAAEQWQGLQQNNPYAFERLGGVGAASAGIGGGMGPGGNAGVGPGASGVGSGGVGSSGGGSFGGGASSGGGGGGYGTGVGSIGAPGAGVGGFGAGAGSQGGWGGASGGGLGNVGYGGMGGAPAGGGYGAGSIGAPGAGGFGSGFGAGAGGVAGAVGTGALGGGYGDFGWGGLGDTAGMGDTGDSGLGGMY